MIYDRKNKLYYEEETFHPHLTKFLYNTVPGGVLRYIASRKAFSFIYGLFQKRFTSTLGGVITETGGMLSHAAVVSREYGIPCILVVKDATTIIKDGDILVMDCSTGKITVEQ
ncbi:MAG: hypothetical protein LBM02_04650 [Lachnospiraceae bacterium]|jgi:hypothetical protein|nr:hypothetical protein [Lachnospiraceae bacterium]